MLFKAIILKNVYSIFDKLFYHIYVYYFCKNPFLTNFTFLLKTRQY